jgi:PAS domain S-box-containing protein
MNSPTYEELLAQMVEERETTIEFMRLINQSATTACLLESSAAFFQRRSGYRSVRISLAGDAITADAKAAQPEATASSAAIPLTVGTEVLGYLHLAEPRSQACAQARLALCERLAGQFAVALARTRAEESLRASEANLRGILNASKESVWFFDSEGRILLANQTALDRLNRSASEVLGRDFAEFVSEDLVALRRQQLRKVIESGQPAEHEDRRNGIDFLHRFYPVFDADGRVTHVATFSQDVTRRKQVEAALQAFYDSSPVMMGICELDGDAIVAVYGNAAVAAFLARPPGAAVEATGPELASPAVMDRTWLEYYRRAQQGRGPVRFEAQHATANGPAWLSVTVSFIGAASSGRPRFSFVAEDITERKHSQERVATLARLYEVLSRVNEAIVRIRDEQSLYQQICMIIAEVGVFPLVWIGLVDDAAGAVVPVASAGPGSSYLETLRVELDGELGKGPTGTAVRENRAVVNHDFATNPLATPWRSAALAHGIRASAAFPLRRDGHVIGAIALYANAAGAFDQEHVGLFEALCADLSYALGALAQERLRTQAERALWESERNLREVDQHKNEFLAVLSHELRNPLAPIVNSLYILDHAPPVGEQSTRARAIIGRQVAQLSSLVNDLLDVTRIARNKAQLQKERVELNEIVRRAVEDHRGLFERARITLDLTPAPRPVFLLADRTRVAQVAGNLLQNAAKFTNPGGATRVSVDTDGDDAVLRVRDDGAGMAQETLDRLFQPFIQADQTLDRSKGGLGLGLALVKGLVELHGGSVAAHSEGLGKGSELVVRLPVDAAAPPDCEQTVAPVAHSRRRVLIIEDNSDAADSLQDALLLGGHEVEVAPDGRAGIDKARAFRPDVIFCDIGLPGMDGFAVARTLRADLLLKGTFLVALSGYALPEDLQRSAEAGFDRHLAKPPRLELLEQLLAESPKRSSSGSG